MSEDDSILLRHMDDVVDTGPDEHHRAIEEMANQMNQHIEIPQIPLTKLPDKSVAVQRQVSPRTTETKAPEYFGAVADKYQWDDRPGGDADKDVQGEVITENCWSEGKNTVSIYLELDGLDDVTDDAFEVESGKTNVSLSGQAANFQAHWLGARNHRRQSSPEERKTDGFPEAREEEREDLAQVAR